MRGLRLKILACAILILAVLISGLTLISGVHASTIFGPLTSDTTWTKADSPITFTGNVLVASNATLTIEPGVTVNFNQYNLQVNGTLIARGDSADKIVFTINNTNILVSRQVIFYPYSNGWNEQTGNGSIIEKVNLQSIIIFCSNASPKISNNEFNNTSYNSVITVNGGSPTITNNNMTVKGAGINVYGASAVISYNTLTGSGTANGISGGGTVTIANNILSTFSSGIRLDYGTYQINDNSIINCNTGIDISNTATATIQRNLINDNQNGISGGSAYIDSNTITNNQIGIHNPSNGTTVSNNNILGNSQNSITATSASINAANNWWGTTDTLAINQTIYDNKNDNRWGTVTFLPFLNGPNPNAPAIPAYTPTPTPVPSQPASTPPPTRKPTEPPPTFTPTPTPIIPKSNLDQASSLFNLNLIFIGLAIPVVLAWIILIIGYKIKGSIDGLRKNSQNNKEAE
jgi:hypothetical protein